MSQTVYRELHPPTTITHCVEAYLTTPAPHATRSASEPAGASGNPGPNLVVVRATRIEVYCLNCTGTSCRLELVGGWQCWGVIDDLAVLKGRGGSSGQKDSLVLAVRDAKVAVVEWDEQQHCLRNSSLHSFEGDPALREGCPIGTSLTGLASSLVGPAPRVVTDPGGRCAAALVYGKQLALLPAIQTDVLEQLLQEAPTVQSKTSSASVGNSYVVNLAKAQGVKLSSTTAVRSWTFLHGYTEPVLLLLYEATPTWGARLRDSRDTCALAALSINLRKKRHPTIWSVHQLPSDSSRVMAVPRGGVLVLSQNLLLYYAQGGSCVMAINSNAFAGDIPPRLDPPQPLVFPPFPPRSAAEIAAATAAAAEKAAAAATAHAKQWATNVHPEMVAAAARGAPRAPGLELEADGAVGCWLAGNVALLSLKTGQLLLVALKFEGTAASKMQVMVAGSSPVASCVTSFTPHLLFLGSQAGDGLLVRHTAAAAVPGALSGFTSALSGALSSFGSLGIPAAAGSSLGGEQAAKRRRLMSLASFDMGGGREGDSEALGAGNMSGSGAGAGDGGGEARSRLLEDEGDIYRSAIGRSQSAVLPALLGAELKQQLKVLDSLMCLAPMRCSVVADLHLRESDLHSLISDDQSERDSGDARASSCLIAAVGSDKSGGLAIMRRSVPADVVTAVPALGAHGAWTIHYKAPEAEPSSHDDAGSVPNGDAAANDGPGLGSQTAESKEQPTNMSEQHHAFLLLSCGGNSTMVLDARGRDMAELTEQVGYMRDVPTLAAGPVFKATAAVQVSHSAVRVVQGSSRVLQHITVQQLLQDSNHPSTAGTADLDVCIRFAQVRDPYVLLLLSDFTVLLLQEDEEEQQQLRLLRAALPDPGWSDELAVATAACLYTDSTGWLAAAAGLKTSDSSRGQVAAAKEAQEAAADAADVVDDDHDGLAQPAVEAAGTEQGLQQQQALGTAGVEEDGNEDILMAEAAATAPAAGDADTAGAPAAEQVVADSAAGEAGQMEIKVQPSTDDKAPSEADHAGDAAAGSAAVAPTDVYEAAGTPEAAEGDAKQLDAAAAASDGETSNDDEAGDAVMLDRTALVASADTGLVADGSANNTAAAAAAAGKLSVQQQEQQEQQQIQQQQKQQQQPQEEEQQRDPPDRGPEPLAQPQQQQQVSQLAASFCVIMRAGGGLQVYALPSMECIFEDAEAVLGLPVLSPDRPASPYDMLNADEDGDGDADMSLNPSPVSEVMMECFAGASGGALGAPAAVAPLLVMLRDSGECLVYKAFKPPGVSCPVGFRRQPVDAAVLGRESPAHPAAADGKLSIGNQTYTIEGMPEPTAPPCRLVRFDNLETPKLPYPLGPGTTSSNSSQAASRQQQSLQLRYSGFFVCGPRPFWLVAARGGVVAHPMQHADVGQVDAFCDFHNVNCPHGYIAAAREGQLNICTLPLQLRLDQPWLTTKLPLRATPHGLAWYPEARLLAVTTSRLAAPPRPLLPADPGGDAVAAAAYATAEAATKAAGVEDLNELQLLAPPGCGLGLSTYLSVATAIAAAAAAAAGPLSTASSSSAGSGASTTGLLPAASVGGATAVAGTASAAAGSSARASAAVAAAAGWAGLAMWRYSLLPGETAMALKPVQLSEGSAAGTDGGGAGDIQLQPFLAVGCASSFGEDYPALGRVLLFQVKKELMFKLEGGSEMRVHGRLALQKEVAGPVTAIESLRGFLIIAVGNKVEMHYKQGNTLVKVNFLDIPQMVSSLACVKDYLLLGQLGHSLAFLRYHLQQEKGSSDKNHQLVLVSQDYDKLEAWAVEFMPNATKLSQVMADGGGNLTVLVYDRKDLESRQGDYLLRRGAAHVGAWVSQFQRMKLSVPGEKLNRQGLLGLTAEGSLLLLSPFWDEAMFKRMASLQQEMVYCLQHTAGLNPKAFQGRYARVGPAYGAGFSAIKPLKMSENTLLQGDLLWAYAGLDVKAQVVIANAVGNDVDTLLQDLRVMAVAADFL